jgi:quercetin dioxygenase-like cupin family protein
MEAPKIVQPRDIKWEPHPQLANAKVAMLVSHRNDGMDLSCMLVYAPVGTVIEKHTHECDDIIYVVKGKAKMWIEEVGDVPMIEGTFIRIPKGTEHQPHDIEEDLTVYDVFYPFLA